MIAVTVPPEQREIARAEQFVFEDRTASAHAVGRRQTVPAVVASTNSGASTLSIRLMPSSRCTAFDGRQSARRPVVIPPVEIVITLPKDDLRVEGLLDEHVDLEGEHHLHIRHIGDGEWTVKLVEGIDA